MTHPRISDFKLSKNVLGHVVLGHGIHNEVLVSGWALRRPVLVTLLLCGGGKGEGSQHRGFRSDLHFTREMWIASRTNSHYFVMRASVWPLRFMSHSKISRVSAANLVSKHFHDPLLLEQGSGLKITDFSSVYDIVCTRTCLGINHLIINCYFVLIRELVLKLWLI